MTTWHVLNYSHLQDAEAISFMFVDLQHTLSKNIIRSGHLSSFQFFPAKLVSVDLDLSQSQSGCRWHVVRAPNQESVPSPSCAEEHAGAADERRQRQRLAPNRRKLLRAFHPRRYPSYQHEDFQWHLHEMCTMERNSRPEYHRNEVFKVNRQFMSIYPYPLYPSVWEDAALPGRFSARFAARPRSKETNSGSCFDRLRAWHPSTLQSQCNF